MEVVPSDLSIPDYNAYPAQLQNGVGTTSIRRKADQGTYSKTRSLFPVYNDLKIAFRTQITQYPIGSRDYQSLTDIFNFSLDLILREGVRFSLLLPDQILSGESPKTLTNGSTDTHQDLQSTNGTAATAAAALRAVAAVTTDESEEDEKFKEGEEDGEEEEYEEDEYEAEALDGFQRIYADVQEQYGESFYILTQNGPLFTSLNGRSSLDPRDYQIPKMFNTTRSLPHTGPSTAYQMSYISPKISPVPHPAIPPTEFMTGFVHPNGVPLPLPTWLNYGVYQSFAPTVDQTNAVLDETVVNSIWFEKYTRRKMQNTEAIESLLSKRVEEAKETEDSEMIDSNKERDQDEKIAQNLDTEMTGDDLNDKDEKDETKEDPTEIEQVVQDLENEDLDFLSTLTWAPDHFIDEDEVEAARTNTEEILISKLLLELQNMQRMRLARNDSTAFIITPEERRTATKIQNMLVRMMSDTTPQELQIQPSSKYPVLQATYQGVLQVPDLKQSSQNPSGMRPNRYTPRKQRRM